MSAAVSDFFHPASEHMCAKPRLCVYCSEPIDKGAVYTRQSGVWEGDWFTNHNHPECFADLCECGDGEFTPYSNERPALPEPSISRVSEPAEAALNSMPTTATATKGEKG